MLASGHLQQPLSLSAMGKGHHDLFISVANRGVLSVYTRFLYPLDCCWTSGLFPTWGIYVPPGIGGRATVVGVGAASASPWLCARWPCPHERCPLGPWPPQGCYGFCFKQQPWGLPAFPLLCVEPFADSVKLSLQGLGLFLCICPLTWGSFQGHILGLDAMGGGSCEDRVWGGGACVAPGDTQLREGSRRLKGCRWLRQAQGQNPLSALWTQGLSHPQGGRASLAPSNVPGAPSPDECGCPR